MKLPDYHWGTLIAAFTGARAEEIASLDVKNIYPVKGVWIFDITKGKTPNAVRRVPIHDKLLELGLDGRIKLISRQGLQSPGQHSKKRLAGNHGQPHRG